MQDRSCENDLLSNRTFFLILVYFLILIIKINRKNLFTKIGKFYKLDRHNFKLVKIKVTCWLFQLMTLIKIIYLSAIIFLII